MADTRTILSIDGGGIRGVIPAMVLREIEDQTGRRIAELFDVIAGTSTGGLIALGLACPDDGPAPRFRAQELVELYEREGKTIFPHHLFGRLRQLGDEKYSADGLEKVLEDTFGDTRLKDALTGVIVPAYDIELREPVFFRSQRAKEDPDTYDFRMRDVARATSAAPTYFEPMRLRAGGSREDYTLVDGGVFANNPGMCAFVDAYAGKARFTDTLVVSLGTGELTRPLPYGEARHWGLAGWGRRILDVVFDGVSDTVNFQLEQILEEHYYRFQTKLDKGQDDLDDASHANVENLKEEAAQLIDQNTAKVTEVCNKLRSSRASPAMRRVS